MGGSRLPPKVTRNRPGREPAVPGPPNGWRVSGSRRAVGDERVRCTRVLGRCLIWLHLWYRSKRRENVDRTYSSAEENKRRQYSSVNDATASASCPHIYG